MILRGSFSSLKTRQNKFASAMGAAKLRARPLAISSSSSAPSTPTGSAVAALLMRHTDSGLASTSSCHDLHSAVSIAAALARSNAVKRYRSPPRRSLLERPIPCTRKSRANSRAASDSPRPRDTPVTIAACMSVSFSGAQRYGKVHASAGASRWKNS